MGCLRGLFPTGLAVNPAEFLAQSGRLLDLNLVLLHSAELPGGRILRDGFAAVRTRHNPTVANLGSPTPCTRGVKLFNEIGVIGAPARGPLVPVLVIAVAHDVTTFVDAHRLVPLQLTRQSGKNSQAILPAPTL